MSPATATAPHPSPVTSPLTSDVPLTPAQRRFFDTFGYLILRGAYASYAQRIIDAFEEVWAQRGGGHDGKPHDGTQRSCLVPFVDQHAVLSALIDDPVIHGAAVSILGEDFNYMGSDGNFYVGDTGWHRDGMHRGVTFIKMAFYLEPLTGSNGALRVVPGSHRIDDTYAREAGEAAQHPDEVGTDGAGIPAIALETKPGDVAIFNHNTLHSSWKGNQRRRMFTMNLCSRWPQERLPELREYLASHARFLIERNVGPEMLRTATPGRMRHLEQVMENDFLLTQRTRELRAKQVEPARG